MIVHRIGSARTTVGLTLYASKRARKYLRNLDDKRGGALVGLLDDITERGRPNVKEKCNYLGDGIWEFKTFQDRLAFFDDPKKRRVVIITHGFKKQGPKTPPNEIRTAKKFRSRFNEAVLSGEIHYDDSEMVEEED